MKILAETGGHNLVHKAALEKQSPDDGVKQTVACAHREARRLVQVTLPRELSQASDVLTE
jgi:hypothetical protein